MKAYFKYARQISRAAVQSCTSDVILICGKARLIHGAAADGNAKSISFSRPGRAIYFFAL
jgi:hypothetical protein